jgi:hypothetical protein
MSWLCYFLGCWSDSVINGFMTFWNNCRYAIYSVIYTSEDFLLSELFTWVVDSSRLCHSIFSRLLFYCTLYVSGIVVLFTSAVCPNAIKWIHWRRLLLSADMLMCQSFMFVWGTYTENCWFESNSIFLTTTTTHRFKDSYITRNRDIIKF